MEYMVEAALVCDKGRLRQNNEDNFYFGGTVLDDGNDGLEEALSLSVNADEKPVFPAQIKRSYLKGWSRLHR